MIKSVPLVRCNEGRSDRRRHRDHTALCEFEWRRCLTEGGARRERERYDAEQDALWGTPKHKRSAAQ